MERLKTILIVILAVISSAIGIAGNSSVQRVYAAETLQTIYERQNVLDDLKGATIENEPFSLEKYNFDESKELQLLTLAELCYSYRQDKQKDFGLYAYVYNPQGIAFDLNNGENGINIRVGGDQSASYTAYKLSFINQSTQAGYEGLFLKFKVEMNDVQKRSMLDKLNSSARIYEVGEFQIMKPDKEFEAKKGAKFTYTGYAKGYGSDSAQDDTLKCTSEGGLLTLSYDVKSTAYRPEGSNGKNEFTQDSLHSVYFAVPNEIIEKYGDMTKIHARWLNATLKPGLVTGNKEMYERLLPIAAHQIPFADIESKYEQYGIWWPYMYLGDYKRHSSNIYSSLINYSYGIIGPAHPSELDTIVCRSNGVGKTLDVLPILLYADNGYADKSKFESTEELLNYVKNYPKVCPPELDPLHDKNIKNRSVKTDNVQAFKAAVSAIPSEGKLEVRFKALNAAIVAYNQLTEEEKQTVQAEKAILEKAIAEYNELVNGYNQDSDHSADIGLGGLLGHLVANKYPASLFSKYDTEYTDVEVSSTEIKTLASYEVDQSWWQHLYGGATVSKPTFQKLKAIQSVSKDDLKGTDEEISKRLAVGKADLPDFREYYDNAIKNDSTIYLFRFYQSDYVAQEATLVQTKSTLGIWRVEPIDTNAYFFQTDVNLNFDIIDVTYTKGKTSTTIAAVMNPIDVIPNPTPPIITTPDSNDEFWQYGVEMIAALATVEIIATIINKGTNKV